MNVTPTTNSSGSTNQLHSMAWIVQVWAAFGISTGAIVLGLVYAPFDAWIRAFLAVSIAMAISSSFALAKTIRDQHEVDLAAKRTDTISYSYVYPEHQVPQ